MFLFVIGAIWPFPGLPDSIFPYWELPTHVLWPLCADPYVKVTDLPMSTNVFQSLLFY